MTTRVAVMVRLALRNLRRQARRTTLTATAMIIGGTLLMFSLPIADGTHEDWIESAVRMGTGHIVIQAPGYLASRKIDDRVPAGARRVAAEALASPQLADEILDVVPMVSVGGLASSPAGARPAQIMAVDPLAEARFSILDDRLVDGRYLEPDDRLAAYIGEGLREALDVRVGSRMVLTTQDAAGEIAGQLVRVVGVYRTGIPEIDQAVLHVPLATAAAWLGTNDDVTTLAVLVRSSRRVPAVQRVLRRSLEPIIAAGDLDVLTWREASPELDAAVKIDDFGNYLFQGILFAIIGLGIVNTILMSVMYRYREFGLLQALGFTPQQTGGLVVVEGVVLTALAGLVGIGLGLFLTWFFFRNGLDFSFAWNEEWSFSGVVMEPVVVPVFRTARVIQGLVFILLVGAIASLYPAYRATRIDVAESMKFER